jgi:hypothetical protein
MPIPAGGSGIPVVPWAPSLVKVADRVPGRTLVKVLDGSNNEVMTFDSTTRPTGASVLRLIDDAVGWVQSVTGAVIDPSLYAAATGCAAVYAAASVELGYPERESANEKDAQALGNALLKQAQDMLTKLAARNDVLVGENPEVFEAVPMWSFPPGLPDDFGFVPNIFY